MRLSQTLSALACLLVVAPLAVSAPAPKPKPKAVEVTGNLVVWTEYGDDLKPVSRVVVEIEKGDATEGIVLVFDDEAMIAKFDGLPQGVQVRVRGHELKPAGLRRIAVASITVK